jgi:stage IV sporulation protein FB
MQKGQKMKLGVSFFSLLMLLSLILTRSYLSLAALVAAALHECGHILAAKLCRIPLVQMKLGIFGATLLTDHSLCSYGKEILLAAAGPAVNIICFATCSLLNIGGESFEFFRISSLLLALLNLLPISELDGGRIVYCVLASLFSVRIAARVVGALSFCMIFSLWALSVYLLLRLGASLSLFTFSCFLFCKIFIKNAYAY